VLSQHKTPARTPQIHIKSMSKQVVKASPKYQDGDKIELPEITTDSENESDSDANGFSVPNWANSPDLRRDLIRQETKDPAAVFGLPGPLVMEDVFPDKRESKFRCRTSSANWSGEDKLTEEECRKNLEGRERLRREGAWTFGMS
jgi:hypothetical protein